MSEINSSREPVIHHLYATERPADSSERRQLIEKLFEVVKGFRGGATMQLLNYLADLEEGEQKNSAYVTENVTEHPEEYIPKLEQIGVISHMPYSSISIDWHHIRAMATYLDARKTMIYTEAYFEPVFQERGPSIMAELSRHDHDMQRQGDAFAAIEDMSESELCDFLAHVRFLVSPDFT